MNRNFCLKVFKISLNILDPTIKTEVDAFGNTQKLEVSNTNGIGIYDKNQPWLFKSLLNSIIKPGHSIGVKEQGEFLKNWLDYKPESSIYEQSFMEKFFTQHLNPTFDLIEDYYMKEDDCHADVLDIIEDKSDIQNIFLTSIDKFKREIEKESGVTFEFLGNLGDIKLNNLSQFQKLVCKEMNSIYELVSKLKNKKITQKATEMVINIVRMCYENMKEIKDAITKNPN